LKYISYLEGLNGLVGVTLFLGCSYPSGASLCLGMHATFLFAIVLRQLKVRGGNTVSIGIILAI